MNTQGRRAEAVQAFEKAIAVEPDNAALHTSFGVTLRDGRQFDRALAVLQKAVGLDPRNANAYVQLGLVLGDLKRNEESLAAQRKAAELDPESVKSPDKPGAARSK